MTRRAALSCRVPDHVQLRDPSLAKVAALSLLGLVAAKVSSHALARHPSPLWLITRHPALAVRLRSYSGKARRRCQCSYCSWKLRACTGSLRRPQFGSARAAALLGKPSRVAARGAPSGAVVHGAAPGRAGSRFACPARSPRAQPLRSRWLGELGTASEHLVHAYAVIIQCKAVSQGCGPLRAGPDRPGSAKHVSVSCPLSVQSKCTGILLPHLGRAPGRSGPFNSGGTLAEVPRAGGLTPSPRCIT